MFYKIFINNRKILLYLPKLKTISEKRGKKKNNNHALKFKVLKCIYILNYR